MECSILFSEELKEYDFGAGHPFRGDRYVNFYQFLRQNFKEGTEYSLLAAEQANDRDLELICHKNYIEFTRGYYDAANFGIPYPGKFNDFHSHDNLPTSRPGRIEEAARLVVGQAKLATQLVMNAKFKKVVSIGGGLHHAKHNYGEGFCLYNDVAFCALYLIQEFGLERILILDTDAHCGNGTMDYFYDDNRVLFIDIHQDPMSVYPGTGFVQQIGAGRGKGFTVNLPMPVFASNAAYKLAFEKIIELVTKEYAPQIIIRNGGSDPHYADGLTTLGLNMQGLQMIGGKTRQLAEICDGRLIDLIASGYNREILPYAWTALLSGILDWKYTLIEPEPPPANYNINQGLKETISMILEARQYLKPYWKCMETDEPAELNI